MLHHKFNESMFLIFNPTYANIYFGYEKKVIMSILNTNGKLCPNSLNEL